MPEMRAPHAPFSHEGADHALCGLIDGHRKAQADAGDGRVDADHPAARVCQSAAGASRVECRVGLDDVVDDPPGASRAGRERAPQGRDDSGGHRASEAVGIADRYDQLADSQALGLAEHGRRERDTVHAQHGQVGERIAADYLEVLVTTVGERRSAAARAASHHVRRGEQEPVRGEGDRATDARRHLPAAHTPHHAQARDRRHDRLGDRDDGPGVGIERLGLGRLDRWVGRDGAHAASCWAAANSAVTVRSSVPRTTVRSSSPGVET